MDARILKENHGKTEEFGFQELAEQQRKLADETAWVLTDGE